MAPQYHKGVLSEYNYFHDPHYSLYACVELSFSRAGGPVFVQSVRSSACNNCSSYTGLSLPRSLHFLITIMLSSTHFFVITSLLSLFRHAALASPVPEPAPSPGPDQKPTIWAHSTIDTMKAQRQILYEYALTMYNQQKHFENPVNCLVPLAPNVNYTVGTDCPNANLVNGNSFYQLFEERTVCNKMWFSVQNYEASTH